MKQKIDFQDCFVSGNNFGDNNKIINSGVQDRDMLDTFIKAGESALNKLDPASEEYGILNPAVVYAKRNEKEKFLNVLKAHSLNVWENIFANVAASGIVALIKIWLKG